MRYITITGDGARWPKGEVVPVLGPTDPFDPTAVDEVKAAAMVEEYGAAVWGTPEVEAPRSGKPKRMNVEVAVKLAKPKGAQGGLG